MSTGVPSHLLLSDSVLMPFGNIISRSKTAALTKEVKMSSLPIRIKQGAVKRPGGKK